MGLSACRLVKAPAIVALATHCTNLVDIRLGGSGLRIESESKQTSAVMALANNCPKLTSIDLAGCENIASAAFTALATKCWRLKILSFAGCATLTDQVVVDFATHCPDIIEIDFMWYVG